MFVVVINYSHAVTQANFEEKTKPELTRANLEQNINYVETKANLEECTTHAKTEGNLVTKLEKPAVIKANPEDITKPAATKVNHEIKPAATKVNLEVNTVNINQLAYHV